MEIKRRRAQCHRAPAPRQRGPASPTTHITRRGEPGVPDERPEGSEPAPNYPYAWPTNGRASKGSEVRGMGRLGDRLTRGRGDAGARGTIYRPPILPLCDMSDRGVAALRDLCAENGIHRESDAGRRTVLPVCYMSDREVVALRDLCAEIGIHRAKRHWRPPCHPRGTGRLHLSHALAASPEATMLD